MRKESGSVLTAPRPAVRVGSFRTKGISAASEFKRSRSFSEKPRNGSYYLSLPKFQPGISGESGLLTGIKTIRRESLKPIPRSVPELPQQESMDSAKQQRPVVSSVSTSESFVGRRVTNRKKEHPVQLRKPQVVTHVETGKAAQIVELPVLPRIKTVSQPEEPTATPVVELPRPFRFWEEEENLKAARIRLDRLKTQEADAPKAQLVKITEKPHVNESQLDVSDLVAVKKTYSKVRILKNLAAKVIKRAGKSEQIPTAKAADVRQENEVTVPNEHQPQILIPIIDKGANSARAKAVLAARNLELKISRILNKIPHWGNAARFMPAKAPEAMVSGILKDRKKNISVIEDGSYNRLLNSIPKMGQIFPDQKPDKLVRHLTAVDLGIRGERASSSELMTVAGISDAP